MNNRVIYVDYLKVFASFAVVVLHVSSQNWYSCDVNTFEWQIFNIFDGLVRWSVPVFVMMSGALFLGRKCEIRKIYTKNILRLITAFIVWSVIYTVVVGGDSESFMTNVFTGHYHMWFIPMMIGLYVCIPILCKIVESEKITKYFLVLAFLITFLLPQIMNLVNHFCTSQIVYAVNSLNSGIQKMDINIVLGYAAYFIGGYYINKIDLTKRTRLVIYLLGVFGGLSTIGFEAFLAYKTHAAVGTYYGYFSVNVLFESLAIYVWFKYNANKVTKFSHAIRRMSECSFGVYLVHVLILELLELKLGLNTLSFNAILSVPAISLFVFLISLVISVIIAKIPFLNKYIV